MTIQHKAWDDVPLEEMSPTITRRIITGEKVMTVIVTLEKGAGVPAHSHESEQIAYVIEGAIRFTFDDGSTKDVKAGEVLVIPSNVVHAAEALEDSVDLDIFSPIREDWLSGDDAYLRGE
jgi:quercetin dioxygenase-like cupin family protein